MGFIADVVTGITGNLSADLVRWSARKAGNTKAIRWLENRLNPDQLHPAARDLLAEAMAVALGDLPEIDAEPWKPVLLHPENRVQLIGWILDWDEEAEPDLAEWSLENAPDPEMLRGLLARLHGIIQAKKAKHFPPEFFNLLAKQIETLAAIDGLGDQLDDRLDAVVSALNAILQRSGPPVPALPAAHGIRPPVGDFTGRKDSAGRILAALGASATALIAGATGQGGVGKTELARYVAQEVKDLFPDGGIEVDMQGLSAAPTSPADAMATVIHAFSPEARLPDDPAAVERLYRTVLHGKRALILLDNAADAGQVRPLVPGGTCALVVTSRQKIALPAMVDVDLDVMPPEEARDLLLGIVGPGRAPASLLDRIAELCGRLPLSLRVAGSFLRAHRDWTAEAYADALADERTRLKRLKHADLDVEAVLGLSYSQLQRQQPDLALRWLMLSVFPGHFDRLAAATVWELQGERASVGREPLSALYERSMVIWDEAADRYRLHDLMRLFADARLSDAERDAATGRHARHYLAVLRAAQGLYLKGSGNVLRGLALFDLERGNIEAGQRWAAARADADDEAARLCSEYPDAGIYCIFLRLHAKEQIGWLEAALAAARRLRERVLEGSTLGNLGNAYAALGETRRAVGFYEKHLAIAHEIGDRRGEGQDLGNLGAAYADLGETRRAIEFHEQYLSIAREMGDRRGEGKALGNLGIAYRTLGETRRAIEFHEQALAIAREIGNRRGEGSALGNLGNAYTRLGETRRAIEFHEQALAIACEIGDKRGEGADLGNLGIAYRVLGETRRAIEFHEQALAIDREIGNRQAEGNMLSNLGTAYCALGETRRAIEFHEQALAIAREIGDRQGEGNALGNLGSAYAALGETCRAIEFYEKRLAIAREIGDRRGEGGALGNLGSVYYTLGEPRRAIEFCQKHLAIAREIGDRRGEGNALGNLGSAYANVGERRRAMECYENGLAIAREAGDRRGEGYALYNRALARAELGDLGGAIADAEEALSIFEAIEDPNAAMVREELEEWRGEKK